MAKLSGNQLEVFRRRYVRKGEDGETIESVDDVFRRVARHVAGIEEKWGGDVEKSEEQFYDMLSDLRFLPNSPTFTGAGTPLGLLSACWVLPLEDDMGKVSGGIFDTLKNMALLFQTGGGVGIALSRLRPNGARVASSGGKATGPVGFLKVYDKASEVVSQGGVRRGAGMAALRVDHPDIMDFITCKETEDDITNFNISVAVDSDFMQNVDDNGSLVLINPQDGSVWDFIPARDVMDAIAENALSNGEPGLLFLDRANQDNPTPHLGNYECTNPCGEQILLPWESCCLGCINLVEHVGDNGRINVKKLGETIELAVRFLDDVVEINAYPRSMPNLMEAAMKTRKIGVGITGLADVLCMQKVQYGSDIAKAFASALMEIIRYYAMKHSVTLAKERGAFGEFDSSKYGPGNISMTEMLDKKKDVYTRYGKFDVLSMFSYVPPHLTSGDPWKDLFESIKAHGIRNATTLTIAPTGTRSTVAGVEGYGCEPMFALAYTRQVVEHEGNVELKYVSSLFLSALDEAEIHGPEREEVLDRVMVTGSCQGIETIPQWIRETFVVARDIDPIDRVEMQAAMQVWVDAGISSTVNLPRNTTKDDIKKVFRHAWKTGCKGITVYVAGSRDKAILKTDDDEQNKLRVRPATLHGATYRRGTPVGTAFVTVNSIDGEPFEVFINVGRAGSETTAIAEGFGRLISLLLRIPSNMKPADRLSNIVEQLKGIGGGNPLGFGKNRIRSLPDGIAEVLGKHIGIIDGNGKTETDDHFDLCPECGNATMVEEEGCKHCKVCGYSMC